MGEGYCRLRPATEVTLRLLWSGHHDVIVKATTRDSAQEHRDAVKDGGDQNPASKAVQNAALGYIRKLREQNPQYERPQVTLMEKEAGKCHPIEDIKKAARQELEKVRQTDKVVNEGSSLRTEQVQPPAKAHGADSPTAETSASSAPSLPPRDSPLTKVFLGQYLSLLVQETMTYRKTRFSDLAREMSISEMVLQEAVQGRLPLTRRRWVRFGQLLGLSTTFEVREGDHNGTPCWELCYPPVPLSGLKWW